ncbi:hypothetical protein [Ottowia sp.]|uniref:hypothetical protein n=1 Tax=Ottowia sp. TaxID=1898956 RepID=UPI002CD819D3|nr:hypothetical protein [Ottowia sp.]HRN76306.1 hypothetical protein [Ottowia sp.]
MRALGLLGLLLALMIVGWLVQQQLGGTRWPASSPAASGAASSPGNDGPAPQRQIQQFKRQLDEAMQVRRELPEDAK